MAHIRNDEFTLYTGFTSNGDENFAAFEAMKASGVPHRHLHYGDPGQHADVTTNIQTWFRNDDTVGEIKLPFVTYYKSYEVTDPVSRVPAIVIGGAAIAAADWVALQNFAG